MEQRKLDHDQRMLAIRMFAEGGTPTEISREMKEKFNIKISHKAIADTCAAKKHQPFVQAFKDQYLAKIKDVPIANKRYRLDDKEFMREKCLNLIKTNPLKSKADRAEFLAVCGRLNQIEAEAREEMEKKPHLFSDAILGISELTDEALQTRKQEIILRATRTLDRGNSRVGAADEGDGFEDSE